MGTSLLLKIKSNRLFSQAQKQAIKGDYLKSIDFYNGSINANPDNPWPYMHKGISQIRLNKFDEAVNNIKEAIKKNKTKDHTCYLFLGLAYLEQGSYDNALVAFSNKNNADNHLFIGYKNLVKFIQEEESIESLKNIKKIIGNLNSDFTGKFSLECEKHLRNMKDKVPSFDEMVDDDLLNKKSTITIFLERKYINIRYLFNKTKRKSYHFYINGREMLSNGLVEESIEYLKNAIDIFPEFHNASVDLSNIYLYYRKKDDLKFLIDENSYFKNINISIHKNHEKETYGNLDRNEKLLAARYFYISEEYEEALKIFKILFATEEKNFYINYYCGLCNLELKNDKEAYLFFKKSMESLNPKVAEKRLDILIDLKTSNH